MAAQALPQRVGRYEILGELARGGMAELYLARLPGLEGFAKQVVVKRLLPELTRDPSLAKMLLEEARLVATLDHQNIVRIHDVGDDDGYFLVMELLQGADVGSLLSTVTKYGGELPLPIAIDIARGALAGLHYAHERCGPTGEPLAIVHRDISPQNLFVTFDGAVKLLDFGIAKAVDRSGSRTQTGAIRGKIPYMSPEQCNAERLDRRSDVFSLSIVLWEMTVGERLYGGNEESELATMKSIVDRDAPPPSGRKPGYPPELERIVMTGLSRDRATRYATADAMQIELEALAKQKGWWMSAREVATFLGEAFPDRAKVWKDSAQRGTAVVQTPRVTAPLPAQPVTTPALLTAPSAAPTSIDPAPLSAAPAPAKRSLVIVAIVAAAIAAVVVAYALGRAGRTTSTTATTKPVQTGEDAHFFQPDDVLAAHDGYKGERLDFLWVAKPIGAGKYLAGTGNEIATETVWKTRIATSDDFAIGTLAFCQAPSYLYKAKPPRDRVEARTQPWMLGRITDISQVANGHVTVANVVCDIRGVRVRDDN